MEDFQTVAGKRTQNPEQLGTKVNGRIFFFFFFPLNVNNAQSVLHRENFSIPKNVA